MRIPCGHPGNALKDELGSAASRSAYGVHAVRFEARETPLAKGGRLGGRTAKARPWAGYGGSALQIERSLLGLGFNLIGDVPCARQNRLNARIEARAVPLPSCMVRFKIKCAPVSPRTAQGLTSHFP